MQTYLIDEAADLLLDSGAKFSDTREGAAVLEMARAYAKQQETRLTAPRMPVNKFVARKEDMSPNGRLRLLKQDDGDVCVAVIEDNGTMASVEFCTPGMGGGKSSRTLVALNDLALAILADNQDNPAWSADR